MKDEKQIDDIIAMLDAMATDGVGHINILVNDDQALDEVKIDMFRSIDCSSGNLACSIPTIQNSIDNEEE